MSALELIEMNYLGTKIESDVISGIKGYGSLNELDCNCIDCGSDAECSTTEW